LSRNGFALDHFAEALFDSGYLDRSEIAGVG